MTNGESEIGSGIFEMTGAGAALPSPAFFLDNFETDLVDVIRGTDIAQGECGISIGRARGICAGYACCGERCAGSK